ncbi:MAG: hypothetical protein J0I06_00480 [Planctomycetes bacterium]|nr:hypothetical protein [Planctomycetota bacterium]
MGIALVGVICVCGTVVSVLMVASGLLRLAISAANKILGPKAKTQPSGIPEWDWDDWDDEYARPARPWQAGRVIPEAGTLKCMAALLLTALVFGLGFVLTGFAAQDMGFRMHREETKLAVAVLNLPVAALTLTMLLVGLLPTRFWRAAMVTFVYGLLGLAFVLFVGVIVFAVSVLFR